MNTKQTLEKAFETADFWVNTLVSDLTDADLLYRPTPDANHIAWQFGHLIVSEVGLVSTGIPDAVYRLPEGFKQQHSKSTATTNDGFLTKDQYFAVLHEVRKVTLAALAKVHEDALDRPVQMPIPFIKKAGDCLVVASGHWLLHAGQWSVVRRSLGKPRLI
jgi:hypothetical protein